MAYNFEEEEQIAELKAWWNKYGTFILTVITVIALAVAAWRLWGWYQDSEAMSAASAYEVLREAAAEKDLSRVKIASDALFDKHGGTIYAPMASLVAARAFFDDKDLDSARRVLQWTVDNAPDSELVHVARLRLAGVMLDQDEAEAALALLDVPVPESFDASYAERRGDLFSALGKPAEAIKAFEQAQAKLGPRSPLTRLIKLKSDALKALQEGN